MHQRSSFGGAEKSLKESTESGKVRISQLSLLCDDLNLRNLTLTYNSQAPSLELNGEQVSESAYIIHRLLSLIAAQHFSSQTHSLYGSNSSSNYNSSSSSTLGRSPAALGAAFPPPSSSSPRGQSSGPIDVELKPSNQSLYYAHWAEGTMMLWMQAALLLRISSAPFIAGRGKVKGEPASEEAREGVKEWSGWAKVSIAHSQRCLRRL